MTLRNGVVWPLNVRANDPTAAGDRGRFCTTVGLTTVPFGTVPQGGHDGGIAHGDSRGGHLWQVGGRSQAAAEGDDVGGGRAGLGHRLAMPRSLPRRRSSERRSALPPSPGRWWR